MSEIRYVELLFLGEVCGETRGFLHDCINDICAADDANQSAIIIDDGDHTLTRTKNQIWKEKCITS